MLKYAENPSQFKNTRFHINLRIDIRNILISEFIRSAERIQLPSIPPPLPAIPVLTSIHSSFSLPLLVVFSLSLENAFRLVYNV